MLEHSDWTKQPKTKAKDNDKIFFMQAWDLWRGQRGKIL